MYIYIYIYIYICVYIMSYLILSCLFAESVSFATRNLGKNILQLGRL